MNEYTIRAEQVESGGTFSRHKGWLELTPTRLQFSKKQGGKPEFEVQLAAIDSVRPKKAFRKGVEVLEVIYLDKNGKRQTKAFERMSWAQWASVSGRDEQNSFSTFERDISEARKRVLDGDQAAPAADDRLERLKQLGELKASGILSEDEFEKEKARILGG